MKIAFFDTNSIAVKEERVLELLSGCDITFIGGPLNEETIHEATDADIVSVFVSSLVSEKVIDALPNLRHIAARSTGLDHIATEHAASKGITVSNVAGYGEHTVAEFTFALLLSLSRKVSQANTAMKTAAHYHLNDFQGFDLFGKTIAVLGTGRIGKRVAHIAKGFGMDVLLYDAFADQAFAESVASTYVSLDEALSKADVVSLHVPSLPETKELMNTERFNTMKMGAYLINTARGDVVDTTALLAALDSGRIAAAALDVTEAERHMNEEGKKLIAHPNVVVTPHIAFCSNEAVDLIDRTSLESIVEVLRVAK